MSERQVLRRIELGDPYWPAQLTMAVVIVVQFTLADRVTAGPSWLAPIVATGLLALLVVVAPRRATHHAPRQRLLALTVIGIVSLINVVSLVLLVRLLIRGTSTNGEELILSGTKLLVTNVLVFAVWFWELDRGGPVVRFRAPDARPDFQFPQMENPQFAPERWRPGFVDYLYLSLTNATAFSPTDTMPLTHPAKAIMAIESVTSLATIGLVLARAVNILG